MRPIRDIFQEFVFTPHSMGTQDRRRIRTVLATFFSPHSLEDGFNWTDRDVQLLLN